MIPEGMNYGQMNFTLYKILVKIIKMSESRYVRKVYNMMRHDDSPDNWAVKIKEVLYRYNFVTACC